MTDDVPRIYLAGPDVFYENARERASVIKAMCAGTGLAGVFPLDADIDLDGLPPEKKAARIFEANVGLIRGCRGVIANMTPFRGPSADAGTAWEMGFARGLGLPVVGYSEDPRRYKERVDQYRLDRLQQDSWSDGRPFEDPPVVEDFGLVDNLMLDCSSVEVVGSLGDAVRLMYHVIYG